MNVQKKFRPKSDEMPKNDDDLAASRKFSVYLTLTTLNLFFKKIFFLINTVKYGSNEHALNENSSVKK